MPYFPTFSSHKLIPFSAEMSNHFPWISTSNFRILFEKKSWKNSFDRAAVGGKKNLEFLINLMKVLAKIFYICVCMFLDQMTTHYMEQWAENLHSCLISQIYNIRKWPNTQLVEKAGNSKLQYLKTSYFLTSFFMKCHSSSTHCVKLRGQLMLMICCCICAKNHAQCDSDLCMAWRRMCGGAEGHKEAFSSKRHGNYIGKIVLDLRKIWIVIMSTKLILLPATETWKSHLLSNKLVLELCFLIWTLKKIWEKNAVSSRSPGFSMHFFWPQGKLETIR